jgi:hypothetical protein
LTVVRSRRRGFCEGVFFMPGRHGARAM